MGAKWKRFPWEEQIWTVETGREFNKAMAEQAQRIDEKIARRLIKEN